MEREHLTDLILRSGVAFAFLFPPINALFDPYAWIGYFPKFAHGIVPDMILLNSFGIVEVSIALWILSGKRVFWPSLAAMTLLLVIVFFNLNSLQVVFRDLSIAAMALALAVKNAPRRRYQR